MPLIIGVDGGFVPGTLCFLLLSDPNLCAVKVFPLFHVRSILSLAHGQGQQRQGGSILELGQSQI